VLLVLLVLVLVLLVLVLVLLGAAAVVGFSSFSLLLPAHGLDLLFRLVGLLSPPP
jgi:hypothetical protein